MKEANTAPRFSAVVTATPGRQRMGQTGLREGMEHWPAAGQCAAVVQVRGSAQTNQDTIWAASGGRGPGLGAPQSLCPASPSPRGAPCVTRPLHRLCCSSVAAAAATSCPSGTSSKRPAAFTSTTPLHKRQAGKAAQRQAISLQQGCQAARQPEHPSRFTPGRPQQAACCRRRSPDQLRPAGCGGQGVVSAQGVAHKHHPLPAAHHLGDKVCRRGRRGRRGRTLSSQR